MQRSNLTTRRRRWALVAIGLLAGATLFGVAAPSSAAPVVQSVGLETGFVVQSNSVMASARVPYNGVPSSVSIAWGDGRTSAGSEATSSVPGVLVFTHEYRPNADQLPFFVTVTATSGGETTARFLQVAPRYLLTKGVDYFTPLAACDSAVESTTEWKVEQQVYLSSEDGPLISSKVFSFKRANSARVNFRAIQGSDFSREMTMADATFVIAWHVTELDPILDDGGIPYWTYDFHPRNVSQTVDLPFHQLFGDCAAQIKANMTIRLLKPPVTLPPPPAPTPTTTIPAAPPAPTTPPAPSPTPPPPAACRPPAHNCQEN
jgi:hypothetical protein